jgi:glycosyltransferase involved in cell wall biosynthesis
MTASHWLCGTWSNNVSAYIALTDFARQKLIAGGFPADRLFVKPNFVSPDRVGTRTPLGFALFVGRLSPEKGLSTLLAAWRHMRPERKLKIVGDGPSSSLLRASGAANKNIEFLGYTDTNNILSLMQHAGFLIVPSECCEGFPRVIAEAFAQGLPVLGSRLGSIEELITHGRTGMLFETGNAAELAETAEWLFTHPTELQHMSGAARVEFEKKYTADRNYVLLMRIYEQALNGKAKHAS